MILNLRTGKEQEFVEITDKLHRIVGEKGVREGCVLVYVPHTTAGVTINENGDPHVVRDIISSLNKTFPVEGDYLHLEGNSHAHIKASLCGSSCLIPVKEGRLQLGRWQGVFFCEFDGPRSREIVISILK